MASVELIVNGQKYTYPKFAKIFTLPFFQNLFSFEMKKNSYTIQLPGDFGSAWNNYADFVNGKKNFKYSWDPQGQIKPKKVYVDLAEFMMDRETQLRLVDNFPQFFSTEFLFECLYIDMSDVTLSKTPDLSIATELYKRCPERIIPTVFVNEHLFNILCTSELNRLLENVAPTPFGGDYTVNLMKFRKEIENYPLMKKVIDYIDTCKTVNDFRYKPNTTSVVVMIKEFVKSTFVILPLSWCCTAKERTCNCEEYRLKYSKDANFIIGFGETRAQRKENGILHLKLPRVNENVVTIHVNNCYEDCDCGDYTPVKVYPWICLESPSGM